MSCDYKRIDSPSLPFSTDGDDELTIDWSLCALCQNPANKGSLTCPFKGQGAKGDGAGYIYIAQNLKAFQKIGENPLSVPLSKLDDGSGFEETLKKHEASWHKSCRAKISNAILNRKGKE